MYGGFKEKIWWPLTKSSGIFFFIFLLLVGGFVSVYFLNIPILTRSTIGQILTTKSSHKYPPQNTNITGHEVPLNCTAYGSTRTCPSNNNNSVSFLNRSSESTCPDYYRWIYEDLRPWAHTGVSREMIEKVKSQAHFRLVILNGNAYVEKYRSSFQTRDVFTLWGVLQLLRMYPGKVPDLELMFNCNDRPVINLRDYSAINATHPPPLFRYCSDDSTLDIPFPDWSFWGWPEIKIKPWEPLMKDLLKGNKLRRWVKREPYAYWKGNPYVAQTRRDLLKCNVSEKQDWNARLYIQDWVRESKEGFNKSNLANQCTHRFKIYIEGNAWSVSEKYILACDSLTLLVNPKFYDFFSRGLRPMQHYWPIKANDKCRSIKHAVDWGNTHMKEAQAIGKAAAGFIREELKMQNVYDYMFHLLNEYAKLLKFKPTIPPNAHKLCLESMVCSAKGLEREYMMDSMMKGPADTNPCTMPPPFHPSSLYSFFQEKTDSLKLVDVWERNYWKSQNKP
ncbi:hypothetical protein FEM48_Zijuj05G0098900 [Ziziphus jujuba var. spinosa]|uniref:Glycosyl transferase CAP10 domain-containing protein n=1 Tax=Ziziphus jujuba var. spinosa TaxID=714518 RepID=A0A978VEA2_ZIZJJ|nr:hypothetical protein FEM48_Zijuj05G0098900 [Ziziphus jujuba var. spinosa]